MRGRVREIGLGLAVWMALSCQPGRAAPACPVDGQENDRIASVGISGDVALASGRTAMPRDIRLSLGPTLDDAALARLRFMAGERVTLVGSGGTDRWGRLTGEVRLGGAAPVDLAELLVAEGLAAVDPGEQEGLCRPGLLALEQRARERRLGLWSAGDLPVPAADRDRIASFTGRMAIVEGEILSVGERRDRTYLDFGRDWSRDFHVTVPKRIWASMVKAGETASVLKGRRVRVRGIVEMRRGPAIELTEPALLERLPR